MAQLKLASLISPHPCNEQQEERNWQAVSKAFQIFDNFISINVSDGGDVTYDLENITNLTATQIDATNIDVTNNITTNELTANQIDATFIDAAYVETYNITYQVMYDNDLIQRCPPTCDASGGSGTGEACAGCTDVDALPATIYMDITWPAATTPVTITLTQYDEQLSTEGLGTCWKKYSGSGAFGDGNSSTDYKVWVYSSCQPGAPVEIWMDSKWCSLPDYMGSESDRETWAVEFTNTSAAPLDGDGTWPGDSVACGYYPGSTASFVVYE